MSASTPYYIIEYDRQGWLIRDLDGFIISPPSVRFTDYSAANAHRIQLEMEDAATDGDDEQ